MPLCLGCHWKWRVVSTLRSGVALVWVNVGGGEGEEERWYTTWKEERRQAGEFQSTRGRRRKRRKRRKTRKRRRKRRRVTKRTREKENNRLACMA